MDILLSKLRNPDRLVLGSGEVFGDAGEGSGFSSRSSRSTTSKYEGASPRGLGVPRLELLSTRNRELVSCEPMSTLRLVLSSPSDGKLCSERSPSVSLLVGSIGLLGGEAVSVRYCDTCDWSCEIIDARSSSAEERTIAAGIVASSISRPLKISSVDDGQRNSMQTDRNMTSSSSPGSLLYSGSDVTEICEGVRRGLRGLRVRGGFDGRFPPLIVPASCSAVSSRGVPEPPAAGAPGGEAPENENKSVVLLKYRLVQIMRPMQNRATRTTIAGI